MTPLQKGHKQGSCRFFVDHNLAPAMKLLTSSAAVVSNLNHALMTYRTILIYCSLINLCELQEAGADIALRTDR